VVLRGEPIPIIPAALAQWVERLTRKEPFRPFAQGNTFSGVSVIPYLFRKRFDGTVVLCHCVVIPDGRVLGAKPVATK